MQYFLIILYLGAFKIPCSDELSMKEIYYLGTRAQNKTVPSCMGNSSMYFAAIVTIGQSR